MPSKLTSIASISSLLLLFHHQEASSFSPVAINVRQQLRTRAQPNTCIHGSFFDDLFGGVGKNEANASKDGEDIDQWDTSGLKAEIERRNADTSASTPAQQASLAIDTATNTESAEEDGDEEAEFDGYMLRDAIFNKFGVCWDVDFQRVESYGFKKLYLNILPFRLGSRRFRHETEYDYLCHLQAVVEILQKYDLLDSVLAQVEETKKTPRPGTSPLVAVPLRLDLSPEQLDEILGQGSR